MGVYVGGGFDKVAFGLGDGGEVAHVDVPAFGAGGGDELGDAVGLGFLTPCADEGEGIAGVIVEKSGVFEPTPFGNDNGVVGAGLFADTVGQGNVWVWLGTAGKDCGLEIGQGNYQNAGGEQAEIAAGKGIGPENGGGGDEKEVGDDEPFWFARVPPKNKGEERDHAEGDERGIVPGGAFLPDAVKGEGGDEEDSEDREVTGEIIERILTSEKGAQAETFPEGNKARDGAFNERTETGH